MTKGQFLTASYYAEVLMSSKQLKFSTLRKLLDLSKLRQELLKKYAEIDEIRKTLPTIEDEEVEENKAEFLAEEYTETFNPIYANTIDNLEAEDLHITNEGKGQVIGLMNCLFLLLENGLIKE